MKDYFSQIKLFTDDVVFVLYHKKYFKAKEETKISNKKPIPQVTI